jgi:chemotaxis protein MotA
MWSCCVSWRGELDVLRAIEPLSALASRRDGRVLFRGSDPERISGAGCEQGRGEQRDMLPLVGIIIVFAAVIGGYLMEHGNLSLLVQPAELVIIGGAAFGSFVIASPKKILVKTFREILSVFKAKAATKQTYVDILLLMFELLSIVRRDGALAIENHVRKPMESNLFTKYPSILKNHHLRDFLCDNLKAFISGKIETMEFESMMELDKDSQHGFDQVPSQAVGKVADSLPGLGIVAAVMGVVLTMGKIKEPPEVLGQSVGAALVGTFLGVLLCYGFVGPMSHNLEHQVREKESLLNVAKASLLGFSQGHHPAMAVEFARRAIPGQDRPTFEELEDALKAVRKK